MKWFALFLLLSLGSYKLEAQQNPSNRQLVLQGFWWDYWNTNYPNAWANYLTELAPRLAELGIDAIWIPPTIKNAGTNSVGYSPFDAYDLGDKYQKNSTRTRVGDKDELLRMVAVMHANGIDVIQDVVLNHVTNAGSANGAGGQDPAAMDDGQTNKYKNFRYVSFSSPASAESASNYLARSGRFPKNWQNFYPNASNPCCTNDINSPYWGPDVSYEASGFGSSSVATYNPAQSSDYMRTGTRNWLIWYKKQVGFDGIRMDAVKHFPSYAAEDFLWNLQYGALWASGGADFFAVGEWVGNTSALDGWCDAVQNRSGTFDFNLRFALASMVGGNGSYDLAQLPAQQQLNRQRTVPFVNNHDTFRPQLNAQGNYTGWNSSAELSPHIEPSDPRSSLAYAFVFSVDGAPQLFFEDLFLIGSNGNRYSHLPTDPVALPVASAMENLIWCHQNLHFKEGAYFVPWQASDALVVEREAKALIGMNDSWNDWQNLVGVQTHWPDGTILTDYSGANGTQTHTVYGGGKVDISIPPCDGTAAAGRRGYCVWAPQGIDTTYHRPAKRTTQEWEMSNDLGDSHVNSLQQGGALPSQSLACRVVGRIYAKADDTVHIEWYPSQSNLGLQLSVLDANCLALDSVTQIGNGTFDFVPATDGWLTVRLRNASPTQAGQNCWVKVNYMAPAVVQTSGVKNKCACSESAPSGLSELQEYQWELFPNPASDRLMVQFHDAFQPEELRIYSADGRLISSKKIAFNSIQQLDISTLSKGVYWVEFEIDHLKYSKSFVIEH
ncbi:MAG: hypothetical protein RLZZ301_1657 [Bacteroidota bacterium]|jgi:alpha-amylase